MLQEHPIDVSVTIPRTPDEIWQYVENIESHVAWMKDAHAIRFTSDIHKGVGTTFECDTKIGPFRLIDKMEITEWEPGRVMGVRHQGIVSGRGQFSLTSSGENQTTFRWAESLKFPWFLGSRLGALVARPILRRVWLGNLRRLKAVFENTSP